MGDALTIRALGRRKYSTLSDCCNLLKFQETGSLSGRGRVWRSLIMFGIKSFAIAVIQLVGRASPLINIEIATIMQICKQSRISTRTPITNYPTGTELPDVLGVRIWGTAMSVPFQQFKDIKNFEESHPRSMIWLRTNSRTN